DGGAWTPRSCGGRGAGRACTAGGAGPPPPSACSPSGLLAANGPDRDRQPVHHAIDLCVGDVEGGHEAQQVLPGRIQQQALALPAGILLEAISAIADDVGGGIGAEIESAQKTPTALVGEPKRPP